MTTTFCCTCDTCGWKDYRLNSSQKQLNMLRNLGNKGIFTCYKCHKGNMTVKQIKWKHIKILLKKFPNKKAIFTKLSVEELIKLDGDITKKPYARVEEDVM